METRFYETQDVDLQEIARDLVAAYQAQGYEAQQAGTPEQVVIQLKKESTLRTITGFNKVLGITLQKIQGGTLVREGAQDWMDQLVVGAVGLALHPLLVTAAVGAATQYSVVQDVLTFIDQSIRRRNPSVQIGMAPVMPALLPLDNPFSKALS